MVNNPSNINYSRALLELSLDNKNLEKIYSNVFSINSILKDNNSVLKLLKIPFISPNKKIEIFKEIFKKQLGDDLLTNFFSLLFKKYKIKEIINILDTFEKLVFMERGMIKLKIKSVSELTEQHKKDIVSKLELDYEKVIFEQKIDKDLIGGFVLMYGDNIYDASIKKRLSDIKNNIRF